MKTLARCLIVIGLPLIVGCQAQDDDNAAATPTPSAPTPSEKIVKSDEQWKQELTDEQYRILRQAGTERAFSHPYHNLKKAGLYKCAGCGAELFRSNEKFSSGCGWPSFYDPATTDAIVERPDTSHGMVRTEVLCARCGGHLGHVFSDAPDQPTGLRYCINGGALEYVPAEEEAQ